MSGFSVKKPYTVLVGVVLVIVLGVVSFMKTTTDLLPSISLPYVIVVTTYPGASPETVEAVVTQPVEAGMATVSNIESISSISAESYSMVIMEFAQSTNMDSISLEIRETLDQIKAYWSDSVGNPMIMKLNPDMLPVMIAAVGVEGMDDGEISDYVQTIVMPELESIEGVASASASGLLEESVHVVIRQEKVEEINKKVRASIDEKMKDAEQELLDGRKTIEDGMKELEDGRKELLEGQKGLLDGEKELADGKQQLADKQDETLNTLASTKTMLTTAKAELETTKVTITAVNGVLDTIEKKLTELENQSGKTEDPGQGDNSGEAGAGQEGNPGAGQEENPGAGQGNDSGEAGAGQEGEAGAGQGSDPGEAGAGQGSDPGEAGAGQGSDPGAADAGQEGDSGEAGGSGTVEGGSATGDGSGSTDGDGSDAASETDSPNLEEQLQALRDQILQNEYIKELAKNNPQLQELLKRLENMGSGNTADNTAMIAALKDTIKELRTTLNATAKTINDNLATVDQGLIAVEKGELAAAIEFANASTGIALGEMKMESAKSQLDAAREQMKAGQEQLESALEQIEDGEKQLEEAREDAYEQADMANVLTVATIEGLLTAQNFAMPAGYVMEEGVEYLVRVGDKPTSVEELQSLPLIDMHMDGMEPITLGDVADVFYTDNSDAIYTNVNGSAGVILSLQKQTGYSTGDVSDKLQERFERLMEENPDLSIITLMDQGIYIDLVMDSIINNILFGAVLAILILLLFLRDIRPTMVVAFSIPISLVTAVVCMYFSGVTLNVISLSGLALGIGMLVDNSIVVIENIYRMRGEGVPMAEAAVEGAKEVAGAITASTLTTVCVFLPIVFTEGITRQLFVDMGLTIAYSLFASLVVALTVVPAMASKTLTRTGQKRESRFFVLMTKGYEKLLSGALHVKPLVFLFVTALLAASVALAISNGTAFMSDMDSTQMTVSVQLEDSAKLADTARVTDEVVDIILSLEDVTDVGAMTNSSNAVMGSLGGSSDETSTTIYVVTREEKTKTNEELAVDILEKTADLPAEISVETSSMDMSAMGGSGITIQVRGRDLDTLRRIATEVAAIVESVEGTANVTDGLAESSTELRVHVKKDVAVKYGLTVAQVFAEIAEKVAAANASTVLSGSDQDYNVYVSNDSDTSLTRELLKEITITGTDAEKKSVEVPLSELADFEDTKSLDSISRADQNRYVSVNASIADGYNVGIVATAVENKLADYEMPDGYRLVFSGENETINDAMEQMMLMLLLALIFMYLIMVAQFQSLLSPFIIMFTIPLAFTGGFLGLYVTGSEVSVIAMIGFVMLAGVIVNNGIVLIDYMNQLRESGMERREAILTAGRTRLRPVLMTALTTILALSTMVFSDDMGAEMSKPMAVVTIGGLLYGTLLTLVVIPCVYDIFARGKGGKKQKRSKRRNRKELRELLEEEL